MPCLMWVFTSSIVYPYSLYPLCPKPHQHKVVIWKTCPKGITYNAAQNRKPCTTEYLMLYSPYVISAAVFPGSFLFSSQQLYCYSGLVSFLGLPFISPWVPVLQLLIPCHLGNQPQPPIPLPQCFETLCIRILSICCCASYPEFGFSRSGWSLSIFVSNKFPGNAGASGTTLQESLIYSVVQKKLAFSRFPCVHIMPKLLTFLLPKYQYSPPHISIKTKEETIKEKINIYGHVKKIFLKLKKKSMFVTCGR